MPDRCIPRRAARRASLRRSETLLSPFATTGASLTVNANLLVHRQVILSFSLPFCPHFTRSNASLLTRLVPSPLFPPTPSVSSYLLFHRPLAPSSATETTDDCISRRIFLMAVIAHSAERACSRPDGLPFTLCHCHELLSLAEKHRNSQLKVAVSDLGARIGSKENPYGYVEF